MFNGIDENGYATCLSKNKQSEYYPLDSYTANAVLVTRNQFIQHKLKERIYNY